MEIYIVNLLIEYKHKGICTKCCASVNTKLEEIENSKNNKNNKKKLHFVKYLDNHNSIIV